MNDHYLFFDLDGTLTDSSEGIINSILNALHEMGITEDDQEKLRGFVGPALKTTFRNNYFEKEEDVLEAVKHYRTYYASKGIFENKLYPQVKEVLNRLKDAGYQIALATAKPTYFANIILEHFEIKNCFDVVVGSHLGGTRTDKKEIIAEVLDQFGLPDPTQCVMVGDRNLDIDGANHHELNSIAVNYGYALPGELDNSAPTMYIEGFEFLEEALEFIFEEDLENDIDTLALN